MLQEEVAVRETDVFSLRAKVQELGKEMETAVNEKEMLEKKYLIVFPSFSREAHEKS